MKRSNFTLGNCQKLVQQRRMDTIGDLANTIFDTTPFLLLEVIFPKWCNFSKVAMSFFRKVLYSPVWGNHLLPFEWEITPKNVYNSEPTERRGVIFFPLPSGLCLRLVQLSSLRKQGSRKKYPLPAAGEGGRASA
ncbi:MAG: hypothetical protein NZ602_03620, partial [Thermoguttaceae bacterium]|nr:hypothetical protein [Thermoguttaceae bacterium]